MKQSIWGVIFIFAMHSETKMKVLEVLKRHVVGEKLKFLNLKFFSRFFSIEKVLRGTRKIF